MQKAVTRPRVHRSCKLTTSHQSPSREKVSWALPVALCGARTGAPSDDAPFFRTLCTEVTSHPFCFILFYLLKAGPGRRHTRGEDVPRRCDCEAGPPKAALDQVTLQRTAGHCCGPPWSREKRAADPGHLRLDTVCKGRGRTLSFQASLGTGVAWRGLGHPPSAEAWECVVTVTARSRRSGDPRCPPGHMAGGFMCSRNPHKTLYL